jgi:hypothetical protein
MPRSRISVDIAVGVAVLAVMGAGCGGAAGKGAATEPPTRAGAVFGHRAPAVGARLVQRSRGSVKLSASVGKGPGTEMRHSDNEALVLESLEEEILAVDAGRPSRVRLTYDEKTQVERDQGRETRTPSPIRGRSYVVSTAAGSPAVVDSGGAPVPEEEAQAALEGYASLSWARELAAAVPSRPLAPGASANELASVLEKLLRREAAGMAPSELCIVFRGMGDEEGTFEVTVRLRKQQAAIDLGIELGGTLRVRRADSMPSALELGGPITVSGGDAFGGRASGSGRMELTITWSTRERGR